MTARAGSEGARLILLSARALGEPIVWGGPIAMNSREELRHAFEEGAFIKHAI